MSLDDLDNPEVCLPKVRVFIVERDYSRDKSTMGNIQKLDTVHPWVLLLSFPHGAILMLSTQ